VLLAQAAGADVLTHAPIDVPLEADEAERSRTSGQVVVPTLTMMEAIVRRIGAVAPVSYEAARSTVGQWHRAGVTILAGTDANQAPSAPASPAYGASLHHELELLVDAGLSAVDALRSATILAARHFGLPDRGVIAAGKRADLVLIDGDPLQDISAVGKIAAVWCAGVPVSAAPAAQVPVVGMPGQTEETR
jgi:imidazolonepropionase-like amidohydrolase